VNLTTVQQATEPVCSRMVVDEMEIIWRMVSSGMLWGVVIVVLTRVTHRSIQKDAILHDYRRDNLKSYMEIIFLNDCDLTEILPDTCLEGQRKAVE
jgi:hypothetical protein